MKKYLVTGATGYIGSMLINQIMQSEKNIHITALVRNKNYSLQRFPEGIEIIQTDLSDTAEMKKLDINPDYIIHCASITKSYEMVTHPVEVTESIINTTQNIMELAKRCKPKSAVMLSSMEVYGSIDCSDGHKVSEQEYGNIELLNTRSCYPLGKRMAENICYNYYKEYEVPVKIARLAQTFGKGILPEESRVFAQFARAAMNRNNIILNTQGNSMGNYCDISDAVSGIITVLHKGGDGEAYNVVNEENTMTIKQMAEMVCKKIADNAISVEYNIPENNIYGYATDTGLRLSGQKLMSLGWRPKKSLVEMYRDIINELL